MQKTCMKNVSLSSKNEAIDRAWLEISGEVADAFRLTREEKASLQATEVAKLIGTLPMIAGCEDAERTAVAHLGIYILSIRGTKHYFHANPGDNTDVFERLRLGTNFKGGNQAIIDKGMSIIALIMINDYQKDTHIDAAIGKYNPVSDGVFDHASLKDELMRKIESVPCPEISTIFNGDIGTKSYWGFS